MIKPFFEDTVVLFVKIFGQSCPALNCGRRCETSCTIPRVLPVIIIRLALFVLR